MELAFIIYTVQALIPAIKGLFVALFCITASVIGFGLIANLIKASDGDHKMTYWSYPFKKRYWAAMLLAGCVSSLMPDEETSYIILAAYGVQTVVENPTVQEIAGNSVKVLDKYMKEYLEEDKNSVKEETK